ncbi:DUF2628 domain-containing protein, partial [Lysobacter sp. TAB13]|uniref:DUF2628 domain-containing protein n=1 Tax=Lysobacter sp. TAB13 TaxID=3233065 RepID=UPI003F9D8BE7
IRGHDMAFYTVLIPPPGSGSERDDIEQARLLPETFSWAAFLFTGFWLLAKRLWLATLLFALVWAAVYYAQSDLGLASGAALPAQFVIGLFLGLEAGLGCRVLRAERSRARQRCGPAGAIRHRTLPRA